MVECKTGRVELLHSDTEVLSSIIHFMYYGEFDEDVEVDRGELLEQAVYLNFPEAIRACCNSIIDQEMTVQNCFAVWSMLETHNLRNAVHRTREFVRENFSEAMRHTSVDDVLETIEHVIEAWAKSELELFTERSILLWLC